MTNQRTVLIENAGAKVPYCKLAGGQTVMLYFWILL